MAISKPHSRGFQSFFLMYHSFFGCICVLPSISGNIIIIIIMFHNMRRCNFMCRWNMNSLFISSTTTTTVLGLHYYSQYTLRLLLLQIVSQWVNKHKSKQCKTKSVLVLTFFSFSLAREKIQLSTCLQLYHLAVTVAIVCATSDTRTTVWERLHYTTVADINIRAPCRRVMQIETRSIWLESSQTGKMAASYSSHLYTVYCIPFVYLYKVPEPSQ